MGTCPVGLAGGTAGGPSCARRSPPMLHSGGAVGPSGGHGTCGTRGSHDPSRSGACDPEDRATPAGPGSPLHRGPGGAQFH
eukprot:6160885-Heterocapsa_arctica.AAC.1